MRKTKFEAARTRGQIINAARVVFHRNGVVRTPMEKVAVEAGVTRGAIYWHFKNKADLFLAVREDAFKPMVERADSILAPGNHINPIDAVELALIDFFKVLDECVALREVFEIMALRCEYVDEFDSLQLEVQRPATELLEKCNSAYSRAAAKGMLRAGFDPMILARDTSAFVTGLLHQILGSKYDEELRKLIPDLIAAHMALRREIRK